MTSSLKTRYAARRLNKLQEVAKKADSVLVIEAKTSKLILEAMDEQDLQKASQIIDKMRKIKNVDGFKASLDHAIDQAEAELNKFTSGGSLAKAWSTLKTKVGVDNPLVKTMTFINALEQGIKQLPRILKNGLGDIDLNANKEKKIAELITDEERQKILVNNMIKALSPSGVFRPFKKIPYMDKQTLVADLLQTPLKHIDELIKLVSQGANTTEIAKDLQQNVTSNSGAVNANPTTNTTASSQTTQTSSTNQTVAGQETSEKTPQQTNVTDDVFKKVANSLSDADEKTVKATINALIKAGLIKQ